MSSVDNPEPDAMTPNIEASPNPASSETDGPILRLRLRQQEILAELGVLALQHTSFPELLDSSVRMAAEGLQSDFCKILEYIPGENRLLLRAGVGWEPGLVGVASVGADVASPSGYALRTGKPVISNHLENEERFRTPELLKAHGVRRAINVILQGVGSPYGVLEVDSRSEGEFSEHDISFLQGAANIVGMAIERQSYERNLHAAIEHQKVLVREINHRVKNSLQLVGAMFQLQAKSADDPQLAKALQEAYGRVIAVARVHERLYRDADVKIVNLSAYLSDVCDDLKRVVAPCEIAFKTEEQINMGTDRAVLLALLIGEFATNAAKHAYPEGITGHIVVRLARSSNSNLSVSVSDQGTGVSEGFDIEKSRGFGMTIIRAFLQQSNARLLVHRLNPGTEFVINIPMD
jgi:two-component sensor histidine kinase